MPYEHDIGPMTARGHIVAGDLPMVRKTKHRILGILVVIGFIVILLPFIQRGKELPSETASVKAPPFPDQSVQVTTEPEQTQPLSNEKSDTQSHSMMTSPSDIISTVHPSIVNNIQSDTATSIKSTSSPDHVTSALMTQEKAVPDKQPVPIIQKAIQPLKNAAWVIQMGSFKNKTNALRLVNQLRANGYHAFIQKVSTPFGESIRVFVGPENKRTTARQLASRLENDMHIHGIVIHYKPLVL